MNNRFGFFLFFAAAFLGSFVFFFSVLSGANMSNSPSCEELYSHMDDEEWVFKVTSWADRTIFHRRFLDEHYKVGSLSGPGLRTATLDPVRASIDVPKWLSGYEIRVVGERDDPVTLIFIGVGRYRGVLVGSDSLGAYLNNKRIDLNKIKHKGRVGVVCYKEK